MFGASEQAIEIEDLIYLFGGNLADESVLFAETSEYSERTLLLLGSQREELFVGLVLNKQLN